MRKGYPNGYQPRKLTTKVGTLELRVPQDSKGNFSTSLFGRYQRNEKALVLALQEAYLNGVSTRKAKETLRSYVERNLPRIKYLNLSTNWISS